MLEKRGSWLVRERRRQPKTRPVLNLAPTPQWREIPIPKTAAAWRKLIREVPGYDPFAGADDYRFDSRKAAHVIRFFHDDLRHVKGEKAYTPFYLERWQQAIMANLFGWVRKSDGRRRYRQAFIFVPRKNGKTPIAAGIVLYLLFEGNEPGAEIYGAASEYRQATFVFEHARGMVLQSKRLLDRCKIYSGQAKSIQLTSDYSTYRVISSDAFTKHGFNCNAYIMDETHTQLNADLTDALETSVGARREPLGIHITTSDYEREGSICNELHAHASKVRDGLHDPEFLPVIYEAADEDDWADPAVWGKANPNLGVSLSMDYLVSACEKAKRLPRYENVFKRLHLNIRTEQDVRWLPMEKWDECDDAIDEQELEGRACYAGLDLASTTDIAAFVLAFQGEDGRFDVLPFFWCPADGAHERERRDRVPYLTWSRQEHIEMTPGNVVDYDRIRERIVELGQRFEIQEIAIDRWNSTQLQTQLQGDGFDVVPFGQGFGSMTAPTKELEKLVLSGKISHGGHPVLRWMASNAAAEEDAAGNIKPSKKKSTEKIDGIVALIMALGRAMVSEDEESGGRSSEEWLVL